MADYVGLIIALAIGLPLLLVAVRLDALRRRRLEGAPDSPPERGAPEVDSHLPAYVTESEIDRMAAPGSGQKTSAELPGTALGFGHALPDFATAGDRAELRDVRVLMVDGEVGSLREVLALLATASPEAPLAVVATSFHEEVLGTLRANRRAVGTAVVAAAASEKDLYELAAVVGGEVLTVADIKAGYTPESALGRADAWTSNTVRTWVEPRKA